MARRMVNKDKENTFVSVLGDKAKPQVARESRANVKLVFNQVGKNVPTFSDALAIVDSIVIENMGTNNFVVLYNKFMSVIAYENAALKIPTASKIQLSPGRPKYELNSQIVENYLEWILANSIFQGLVEGYSSEVAARRMAMENATKNSEAIVSSLTMQYNRTRQAVITNELVDIITGASAL